MSRVTSQPVFGVSDQPTKKVRDLKFQITEEEALYYICSETKGTNQLQGYLLICAFVFIYV